MPPTFQMGSTGRSATIVGAAARAIADGAYIGMMARHMNVAIVRTISLS